MLKKPIVLGLFALLAGCHVLTADQVFPFERYDVILQRKPFGDVPPPPPPPPKPFNAAESFAKTLKMTAILDDDGVMKIGLIDTSNNNSFFLAVGDMESGVELVSADYETEKAVLRKDDELAEVSLGTGTIVPVDPNARQGHLDQRNAAMEQQTETARISYADRRRQRQEQRKREILAQQKPTETRYSGEDLKKHLEEYQMEVIRNGLPALPIPLTEEMDAQLVEEGVLEPQ